MKKLPLIGFSLVFLGLLVTGCVTNPPVVTPHVPATTQETQVQTTQEVQNGADVAYSQAVFLDPDKVLTKVQIDGIVAAYNQTLTDPGQTKLKWVSKDSKDYTLHDDFNFYQVGKIQNDPYKNWNLLVLDLNCDGPCSAPTIYRFASNPQTRELAFLSKYSAKDNEYDHRVDGLKKSSTVDNSFEIPSLNTPETLAVPNTQAVVTLKFADSEFTPDMQRSFKRDNNLPYPNQYTYKLFDSAVGPVYADGAEYNPNADSNVGCVHVKKPDGSVATYSFDPGLDNTTTKLTMKDGTSKSFNGLYVLADHGCGIGASCYYTRSVDEKNLEVYATLSTGLKLYKPVKYVEKASFDDTYKSDVKYKGDKSLPSQLYESYVQQYEYGDKSKPKLTFAQFTAKNPVLFWKDPFNRWSAIVLADFNLGAECGKPVVYLYPQKDTEVSVKVGIDQLTKTLPDYGNGWNVLAHVGGRLTNLADGADYPYLFWEGKSSKQVNVDKGFSVARADLKYFLASTLAKSGFNSQESTDFMDFWYPRMMANQQPYFVISFLGTQDFNKIAPLTIDPRPDTLARLFMYYKPSDVKVSLQPQVLKSFARRGFTVVEWGGTSNAPWIQ